ncbi:hypothetical protein HBA92_17725 [Ochrobactrum sp. MR28]|nr:hypothetical protein [Ochrobactrum sp. MR28]MBX8818027.1 hypothetical protein [Ochrobactrum sp. MR31]
MIPKNLLLCALLVAIGGADAAAQSINKWPICGRAKRITCIVDGDTFWMDRVKYRLQGVDTPETGDGAKCAREQKLADAATLELQRLMETNHLYFQRHHNDRYGRVIVTVRTQSGDDIADLLVRSGHGRPYYGGRRDAYEWCRGG